MNKTYTPEIGHKVTVHKPCEKPEAGEGAFPYTGIVMGRTTTMSFITPLGKQGITHDIMQDIRHARRGVLPTAGEWIGNEQLTPHNLTHHKYYAHTNHA